MISFIEDGGKMYKCHAIEYDNKYWLVGGWLENPVEKWMQPKRLIGLETLKHQQNFGSEFADFLVTYSIPKSVFKRGVIPKQSEDSFVIVDVPDIHIPSQYVIYK